MDDLQAILARLTGPAPADVVLHWLPTLPVLARAIVDLQTRPKAVKAVREAITRLPRPPQAEEVVAFLRPFGFRIWNSVAETAARCGVALRTVADISKLYAEDLLETMHF